ncbi:hypothetical protein LSUE1_G006254 [Lachnellula suecica]|uniref:Uncharacterized protein n=1 Tax=Lachnellula suecica TaxID=602035 RepID=A0A8T9C706_9HELO|nr:hypothetical protein LSUE1_G006254 [Lachnellula suecica]
MGALLRKIAARRSDDALQSQLMGLKWVLVTLRLNTLGAAAYAIKWASEWLTQFVVSREVVQEDFRHFGATYQWLHIMVILAGLAHTIGLLQAFDFLHTHPTECRNL